MKVIYLTTHVEESDFLRLVSRAKTAPNPAGQNFHGKIIAALSKYGQVKIYSLIPNKEGILKEGVRIAQNGLCYCYFAPAKTLAQKAFLTYRKIALAIQRDNPGEPVTIVYDSLNVTLAKAARLASQIMKAPRVAICSDDPRNISFTRPGYAKAVLQLSSNADGYLCLTKKLNLIFNHDCKKYLLKPGVVEEGKAPKKTLDKPYIYYGGALFEKDGVADLIDGYFSAKPALKLVIAGHGPMEEKLRNLAKEHEDLVFLGQISKQDNYAYEKGAALAVNPRLYNADLDAVSVPSKVLEYLSNAPYVASTLSTSLKALFPKDVNWIEGENFGSFLKRHLDPKGNLRGLARNKAKEKIASLGLSKETFGRDFYHFLSSIKDNN